MRWIFFTLLIANLAFFSWYTFFEQDAESSFVAVAQNKGAGAVRIKLLTEMTEADIKTLEKRSDNNKCDVYGPFFSLSDSQSFLALLRAAGFVGRVEREDVNLKPYFWAYLSPQKTLQKARILVNRLRDEKVNAELIEEGLHMNGISLGDFETKALIDSLRRQLSQLGMLVNYERKSRDYKRFWVLLDPGSEEKISARLRDKLIFKYPDIFHQQKDCKAVASS